MVLIVLSNSDGGARSPGNLATGMQDSAAKRSRQCWCAQFLYMMRGLAGRTHSAGATPRETTSLAQRSSRGLDRAIVNPPGSAHSQFQSTTDHAHVDALGE